MLSQQPNPCLLGDMTPEVRECSSVGALAPVVLIGSDNSSTVYR